MRFWLRLDILYHGCLLIYLALFYTILCLHTLFPIDTFSARFLCHFATSTPEDIITEWHTPNQKSRRNKSNHEWKAIFFNKLSGILVPKIFIVKHSAVSSMAILSGGHCECHLIYAICILFVSMAVIFAKTFWLPIQPKCCYRSFASAFTSLA